MILEGGSYELTIERLQRYRLVERIILTEGSMPGLCQILYELGRKWQQLICALWYVDLDMSRARLLSYIHLVSHHKKRL